MHTLYSTRESSAEDMLLFSNIFTKSQASNFVFYFEISTTNTFNWISKTNVSIIQHEYCISVSIEAGYPKKYIFMFIPITSPRKFELKKIIKTFLGNSKHFICSRLLISRALKWLNGVRSTVKFKSIFYNFEYFPNEYKIKVSNIISRSRT